MDERTAACHWLLMRLAGAIPDDALVRCRDWLAEGDLESLARVAAHAVRAARVPLSRPDLDLLVELLDLAGIDTAGLSLLDTTAFAHTSMFRFAATREGAQVEMAKIASGQAHLINSWSPAALDGDGPVDRIEQVLAVVALEESVVLGVWRAWRYPADGAPWPPPHRVFLVETDTDADLAAIAACMQQALLAAGEADPQVEVYSTGAELSIDQYRVLGADYFVAQGANADFAAIAARTQQALLAAARKANPQVEVYSTGAKLPSYQYFARAYGGLVWARDPDPGVRIARLYDEVDPVTGPRINPDYPRMDEPERGRVLRYLGSGEVLLEAMSGTSDVVDQNSSNSVPQSYRTDGFWIWNDAAEYYLKQHGVAPDVRLVEHIRARGYAAAPVNSLGRHRAHAALTRLFRGEAPEGRWRRTAEW